MHLVFEHVFVQDTLLMQQVSSTTVYMLTGVAKDVNLNNAYRNDNEMLMTIINTTVIRMMTIPLNELLVRMISIYLQYV